MEDFQKRILSRKAENIKMQITREAFIEALLELKNLAERRW